MLVQTTACINLCAQNQFNRRGVHTLRPGRTDANEYRCFAYECRALSRRSSNAEIASLKALHGAASCPGAFAA